MYARTGDAVMRGALLLLVFLSPFFVLPVPWSSVAQAKVLLAAFLLVVALAAWTIARLSDKVVRVPRSPLFWSALLLPLAYFVSALAAGGGPASYASGTGAQGTVDVISLLFLACALTAFSASSGARLLAFVRAFILGMLAVVLYQWGELFFPALLSLGGAVPGKGLSVVGSWHDLGIASALCVFLAAALFRVPGAARGAWAWLLRALGVASLALLLVVGLPDVWYALGAFALLFAALEWRHAREAKREGARPAYSRAGFTLALGVIALALGAASGHIAERLPPVLQVAHTEALPSWRGTFSVAGDVVSSPRGFFFGSGPNTFAREWGLFKPPVVNESDFWSVDFTTGVGFLPTAFATMGLVGFLAWIVFLLALSWSALSSLITLRASQGRVLRASLVGGALYLAVFHVLYSPGFFVSLLLFLLLGLVVAFEGGESGATPLIVPLHGSGSRYTALRVGAFACGVTVFLFAGFAEARATVSDMLVERGVALYSSSGDLLGASRLVGDALLVYSSNDAAHRAAVELGLLELEDAMTKGKGVSAEALQASISRTIQHGLSAVSIDSAEYKNWLSLAGLYRSLAGAGVQGAYENATRAYARAASENPTSPLPLIGQAQVALAQGDATSSIAYLDKAVGLKPDLAASYFVRSQAEASLRDYRAALSDARQAVSLAGEDATAWYNLGVILYASSAYGESVEPLERAAALRGNYANALFMLALSYEQIGRKEDAAAVMRRVASLNPNDETVASILKKLEAPKATLRKKR